MANYLHYCVKAVAKDKSALERLYKIMNYEDADYCLYRVLSVSAISHDRNIDSDHDGYFDCDEGCLDWFGAYMREPIAVQDAIYEDEGDGYAQGDDCHHYYGLVVTGDVAWSADPWFDGTEDPDELADNGTAHLTSLNIIAKELGIGVELWGVEEFNAFQQHFIMNAAGEMVVAKSKNRRRQRESEIEDRKLRFENMWGFGDDYGILSSAKRIYEGFSVCGNAKKKKGGNTLKYEIKSDKRSEKKRYAAIIGVKKINCNLKIPAEIEGWPVTGIDAKAFKGRKSLKSVTIPDSVTSIGEFAFADCSGLTELTIPDSVTSIGDYAFQTCSRLTSVTMPNSVTSIGDSAFNDCSSLTKLTIPDSVTSIGAYAFCYCSRLTSMTIPDSVTSIGRGAFMGCGFTNVTIPDSVTSIGVDAFKGCTGLTSVSLPGHLKGKVHEVFGNCSDHLKITYRGKAAAVAPKAKGGKTKTSPAKKKATKKSTIRKVATKKVAAKKTATTKVGAAKKTAGKRGKKVAAAKTEGTQSAKGKPKK